MITCWLRDPICGEGIKSKTKQLLAAKLFFYTWRTALVCAAFCL
jgi:hypothetical protein